MIMADHFFTPDHAYIPGQNHRHPEGLFDAIKEGIHPNLTPLELINSKAMAHGLFYLEKGFYWEAHEVLEPIWMALESYPMERHLVQALIQIANGLLKLEMGQPKAATRLSAIAHDLIVKASADSEKDSVEELSPALVQRWVDQLSLRIKQYNA